MENPIISVIIPTYNREKLIMDSIDSVLNQTFQDFEILIIDDVSTDNTEQLIKDLNNEKIRYYKLDKNGGQCIARNYGIKKARGKYIAFLDSDDRWLPEKLEKQLECFKNGSEKLGCVYAYGYEKDVIRDTIFLTNEPYYRGDLHEKFLDRFCPPTPSLFMVKKEALEKVNGFDEKLITFVDLDLWLRISKYYEFDYVNEPLITKYEQIGDQYVNNFEKRYNGFRLFIEKWKDELIQKIGIDGFRNFKKALVGAVVVPILEHPPVSLQKNIKKLIMLLFEVRSTRVRLYLKSFLVLFFGPNVLKNIRQIKGTSGQ